MTELPDGVSLVNAVGGGDLGIEVSLEELEKDLDIFLTRYKPESYPALYMQFEEDSPKVSLFRTGSYHIAGASSIEEVWDARADFFEALDSLGIPVYELDDDFAIRNLICVATTELDLNLNALAIGLGLENVEYEPEQFPGLVYRSSEIIPVLLIFASGKIVMTGANNFESVSLAYEHIQNRLSQLMNSTSE